MSPCSSKFSLLLCSIRITFVWLKTASTMYELQNASKSLKCCMMFVEFSSSIYINPIVTEVFNFTQWFSFEIKRHITHKFILWDLLPAFYISKSNDVTIQSGTYVLSSFSRCLMYISLGYILQFLFLVLYKCHLLFQNLLSFISPFSSPQNLLTPG